MGKGVPIDGLLEMKGQCHSLLDRLAYWVLPQGVHQLLRETCALSNENSKLESQVAHLRERNLAFKEKHKGQRCFILATGPSVAQQNLLGLANEDCIAVSHFFLHEDIRSIAPRYHVIAPYHAPFDFADVGKMVGGLHENYPDDMTCFFCHSSYQYSTYEFFKQHPELAFKNSFFIDYSGSRGLDESNYLDERVWDISKSPFQVRTVIYAAIQLAIYMSYKEIYLVGCDHDYLLDMNRVRDHHFYREEDGVSDVEHLSGFSSERWFEEYYFRWKQYRLMQDYARQKECQILNATKGGMLDVFPRVVLEDILPS